jgi:outer membrane protein TolC
VRLDRPAWSERQAHGTGARLGRAGSRARRAVWCLILGAAAARAQTPPPPAERVAFDEAIRRAVERNPSTAIAAAGILRAEGLLTEAQANTRLQINGTITTTTLNRGVEFQGATVTPQNQVSGALDVRLPLFAPARWARRAQAQDAKSVAELSAADARRQTAFATADAYLTIIARRRVIDANERARDTARAHFDLARELEQRGTGSRLNQLRAQQELSTDEGLVESARLALYRAQEALGVLLVAGGPVDATEEPSFSIPEAQANELAPAAVADRRAAAPGPTVPIPASDLAWLQRRTDVQLFAAGQHAAERILRDSSKDYYPYLEGVFLPQTTYPAQFFVPANSWRFQLQMSVPLFDSGQRRGVRAEREAALNIARATFLGATTQASAEIRAAREAVQSAERGLASARDAADQAQQVVNIVNVSFRAGAATNIEVIDAERRARDTDTAVAVAEDTLRRARLELLTALGRFPQ